MKLKKAKEYLGKEVYLKYHPLNKLEFGSKINLLNIIELSSIPSLLYKSQRYILKEIFEKGYENSLLGFTFPYNTVLLHVEIMLKDEFEVVAKIYIPLKLIQK
jgi:hypothetical protein